MAKRKNSMRNLVLRNGIYQFKKTIGGVSKQFSLDTSDLELAKEKRDKKLKELDDKELAQLRGPRAGNVRVGKVLELYENGIASVTDRIEPTTVKANVRSMHVFLQWAHGDTGKKSESFDDGKVAEFSVKELSASLAGKFVANYLAAAGKDRQARDQRRRGADSVLRQMKSVFSKKAMRLYQDLQLPDLKPFLAAAVVEADPRQHKPISAAALAKMHEAIELARVSGDKAQQQLWLVHALHKFCGLRNEEIRQVRVEWFVKAPWGQVFLSVITRPYFEPKGNEGHVPIHSSVVPLLAPFVQGKQPTDFLIEARVPSDRADLVDRTHAAWMRQFLPADVYVKAGYELRRWGAQTMELRYGLDASENFLRHSREGVASRHYLEAWSRWKRLGDDVGVTIEDATGQVEGKVVPTWEVGAAALQAPAPVGSAALA